MHQHSAGESRTPYFHPTPGRSPSGNGRSARAKCVVVLGMLASIGCQTGCAHRKATRVAQAAPEMPPPAPRTNTPSRGMAEPQNRSPIACRPTWYPQGRPISQRWTHVVIHHSATPSGSARSFDQFHRGKGWDELGYHFVIGNGTQTPDGFIETGSRWQKQKHGAHCKTPDNYFNDHGIGICLVGDFTGGRPTRKQLTSLYQLVSFLSGSCGIPPERITTHAGVTSRTQCPGRNFPLQPLRDAIRASSRLAAK